MAYITRRIKTSSKGFIVYSYVLSGIQFYGQMDRPQAVKT